MTTLTPRELFARGFDTMEIANMLKRTEFDIYNELGRQQGTIAPKPARTYDERKAYMRNYYRRVIRPKVLAKRAAG